MVVGSENFLVPNATFFVELAAFLLVLFILGRYVLPRITKPMEERQATIRQALEDAEEAKRRAAEAEEEYERILARARADIDAQVRQASETLRQQVGDMAVSVVEKVLGDGLDQQSHLSLVDRTIAEVEAQAGATGVRT